MSFWTDITLKEPMRQNRWYILFGDAELDAYRFALKECSKPEYNIDTVPLLLLNQTFNYPKNVVWKPITVKMVSAMGRSDKIEPFSSKKTLFGVIKDNYGNDSTVSRQQDFEGGTVATLRENVTSFTSEYFFQSLASTMNDLLYSTGHNSPRLGYSVAKRNSCLGIQLIQVDSNGNTIETWKLTNSFISNVNYGTLSYASDEFVDISFTITYDNASLSTVSPSKFDEKDVKFGYQTQDEIRKLREGYSGREVQTRFGYNGGDQTLWAGSPGLPQTEE